MSYLDVVRTTDDPAELARLVRSRSSVILRALAQNPNIHDPADLLLAESTDARVLTLLAGRSNPSRALVERLLEHRALVPTFRLISNETVPADLRERAFYQALILSPNHLPNCDLIDDDLRQIAATMAEHFEDPETLRVVATAILGGPTKPDSAHKSSLSSL